MQNISQISIYNDYLARWVADNLSVPHNRIIKAPRDIAFQAYSKRFSDRTIELPFASYFFQGDSELDPERRNVPFIATGDVVSKTEDSSNMFKRVPITLNYEVNLFYENDEDSYAATENLLWVEFNRPFMWVPISTIKVYTTIDITGVSTQDTVSDSDFRLYNTTINLSIKGYFIRFNDVKNVQALDIDAELYNTNGTISDYDHFTFKADS